MLKKSSGEPVCVSKEGGGEDMGQKNILMLVKSEDMLAAWRVRGDSLVQDAFKLRLCEGLYHVR